MDSRHVLLGKINESKRLIREVNYQIAVLEQQRSEAAIELHSRYEALCQLEPLAQVIPLVADQPLPAC